MKLPLRPQRRQTGVISVWVVILLIVGVIVTLTLTLEMSGTNSLSSERQLESTRALYVAESGLERAQSILYNGAIDSSTCDLVDGAALPSNPAAPFPVGSGSFEYPNLTFSANGNQNDCSVTVKGSSGGASRTLKAVFSSQPSDEGAGCGSSLSLAVQVTSANAGAFTNTAYRAKAGAFTCVADPGNSNAIIGSCTLTKLIGGGITSPCDNGWSLERTGTTNISSHGAFQGAPDIANYSIKINLVLQGGNPPPPATRNYVVTGVVAYPESGKTVQYIGSYATDTGSDKTSGTSQVTGSIDNEWTCQPNNGSLSTEMVLAGKANTLLYGFSSWPQVGSGQLNGFTLGIQPFRRIKSRFSNTGDNVYSQVWFTYNNDYYPLNVANTVVTGARNGASFNGAVGARVTGSISGTTLTVTSNSGGGGGSARFGELRNGDSLSGSGVAPGTTIVGSCTGTTPTYTCTVNPSQTVGSTTISAASNILRVSAPLSGILSAGDIITSGLSGSPAIQPFNTPGTTGNGTNTGDYVLSTQAGPINVTAMESSGNTITVPVASTTIPAAGTAVAVASGTGVFSSTVFTGSITSGNLTSAASITLCEGDVLFGSGVRNDDNTETGIMPKTRITGPSGCTTGTGPWTVSGTTDAPSGTIVARTGVLGTPTPTETSFKISRVPTQSLSNNAVVCGGVCALFFNASNVINTTFTLSGLTSGDDWASGFACMSGVDSANIQTIGLSINKRSEWSEVINP